MVCRHISDDVKTIALSLLDIFDIVVVVGRTGAAPTDGFLLLYMNLLRVRLEVPVTCTQTQTRKFSRNTSSGAHVETELPDSRLMIARWTFPGVL